jgi:hypothetical protein
MRHAVPPATAGWRTFIRSMCLSILIDAPRAKKDCGGLVLIHRLRSGGYLTPLSVIAVYRQIGLKNRNCVTLWPLCTRRPFQASF